MIRCIECKGWKQVDTGHESQQSGSVDVSSRLDSTRRPLKEVYQSWAIQYFGNLPSASHCGDDSGDHVGHEQRGAAS